MFHELTLFFLFNSSTILKELDVSLLHRTTSLCPRFFTLLSIPPLVLIQLTEKLINILIFKFFSSFLSRSNDKKGEKTKMYFFYHLCNSCTYIVYDLKIFFLSQLLSCVWIVCFWDSVRFCHLPKKGEIVELHSMLLTISPFIFWDNPKILSKSILSSLDFG